RSAPPPHRHDRRPVGSDDLNREIAFAGQRVKQKVIFALTLASVIPLLILTYAFQAPVRQILGPIGQYTEAFTMPARRRPRPRGPRSRGSRTARARSAR